MVFIEKENKKTKLNLRMLLLLKGDKTGTSNDWACFYTQCTTYAHHRPSCIFLYICVEANTMGCKHSYSHTLSLF